VLVEPTPARPLPVAGRTTGALGLARAVVLLAIAGPGDGQRVGGELAAAGGGIAAGGVVEATVARLERLGRAAGERQETQRRAENDRTPAKVRHGRRLTAGRWCRRRRCTRWGGRCRSYPGTGPPAARNQSCSDRWDRGTRCRRFRAARPPEFPTGRRPTARVRRWSGR